jgi:transcriptional regulator with XRE-family HTH domain
MSQRREEDAAKVALRTELAKRIRAARAFAGIDQAAVAEALGVSVITVKRMERGARDVPLDELQKLAEICEVPREFLEHGFLKVAHHGTSAENLREIQTNIIDALDARMELLSEALLTREEAQRVSRDALARLRRVEETG